METIRDVTVPQAIIELFCRVFDGTTFHSLHMDKYLYENQAILRKYRAVKKRRLAILQRELEARRAVLNAEEDGLGAFKKYFIILKIFLVF